MPRLPYPNPADAPAAAQTLFAEVRKAVGKVPNAYAAIGGLSPAALGLLLQGDALLGAGTLPKADIEAIRLAISAEAGCDYCVAAHSMVGQRVGLPTEALRQLRAGGATGEARRDALVQFALQAHRSRATLPAEQVQAVLDAGHSPAQVMEALLVIALITFTNLVNKVNDTALDFPQPA